MGCFNMRCAATGVPIVHNTPVVMFDLCGAYPHHVQKGLGLDKFGDQMAVMSMPRFGLYNDYGDIESEEDRGWEWINSRLYLEAQQMTYVPKFEDGQYQDAKRQADERMVQQGLGSISPEAGLEVFAHLLSREQSQWPSRRRPALFDLLRNEPEPAIVS